MCIYKACANKCTSSKLSPGDSLYGFEISIFTNMVNMDFNRIYKRWEHQLGAPFLKYGALVSRYPWHVMVACITVNCLLGAGMLLMETETDPEKLLAVETSQSMRDRAIVDSIFTEDKSGSNFFTKSLTWESHYADIIFKSKNGSNILTQTFADEIEKIHNFIMYNISITSNGTRLNLLNVCALRSGHCVVEGDVIFREAFRTAMDMKNITFPLFNYEYLSWTFGDAEVSDGYLHSASMMRMVFYLRQDTPIMAELSSAWEKRLDEVLGTYPSSILDMTFSTSRSVDDELEKVIIADIPLFVLSMVMMLVYAGFATSGGNCVSDRQNLSRAGVIATFLSAVGAIGLVSAIGVKFVVTNGILPFLIIGIGLDDMFILLSCLADCSTKRSIEDRIKETMRTGGVSITITSVTDFLAFAIGVTVPIGAIKNFCVYAGVTVILCYLNQLTFFVPCMVINERRVSRNNHCVTCRPVKTAEELRVEGKSYCNTICCSGQPPKNKKDNESPLETYFKIPFQHMVRNPKGKVVILLLFIIYLSATIYGLMHFERGLRLSYLVKEDSIPHTYYELFENYFTAEYAVGFIITTAMNYSDVSTQNRINEMLSNARADRDVNTDITYSWLTDYKKSLFYNDASETRFIAGLKAFLILRIDHANDVVFSSDGTSIVGARFYILTKDIPESKDQGDIMVRMRDVAENSPLPVVCFSWPFVFFDEYAYSFQITFTTIGMAIAAMFVVTLIFMPHPLLLACVTATMVLISAGILGFMYYWELTLNAITMINIIMSIGFSVDFSAHICHAYITVDGHTREERVHRAINRSGGPIINAAMSSIIGIVSLAFTTSYVFNSFVKLMFLVMVFGLAHALLFLPLLLSLIGPLMDEKPATTPIDSKIYIHAIDLKADIEINGNCYRKEEEVDNVSLTLKLDVPANGTTITSL
ncbi:patched domain-containing protein 3-like [Argopecten irradians]|uniref:patched domain-containing protein 3-like n=1 Tax=Argopecten irradians TaxID=31199 RepID=UPI00371F6A1E